MNYLNLIHWYCEKEGSYNVYHVRYTLHSAAECVPHKVRIEVLQCVPLQCAPCEGLTVRHTCTLSPQCTGVCTCSVEKEWRRAGAVAGACRAGQRVRCTSTADRCVDRSSSSALLQTPHCSPAAARVYAAAAEAAAPAT